MPDVVYADGTSMVAPDESPAMSGAIVLDDPELITNLVDPATLDEGAKLFEVLIANTPEYLVDNMAGRFRKSIEKLFESKMHPALYRKNTRSSGRHYF